MEDGIRPILRVRFSDLGMLTVVPAVLKPYIEIVVKPDSAFRAIVGAV